MTIGKDKIVCGSCSGCFYISELAEFLAVSKLLTDFCRFNFVFNNIFFSTKEIAEHRQKMTKQPKTRLHQM